MLEVISNKAIENKKFDLEAISGYGAAAGTIVSGMCAAHIAVKLLSKVPKMENAADSMLVNAGLAGAGVAGAIYFKNPWLKLLSLGVASYGGLKVVSNGVKAVTAEGNTGANGLSGLLPESIKAKIRDFIPSLGSAETLLGEFDFQGAEPNLDDAMGDVYTPYEEVKEPVSGFGSVLI